MDPKTAPNYSWRHDPRVPDFSDEGCVTVMDALCGICSKSAKWIARNDADHKFIIVPQQSALGYALLTHFDMDPADPVSWLYLEHGRAYSSMDAAIRAGQQLGGAARALMAFKMLPAPLRNWLYLRVARNRYAIWGRADLCAMPDPEVQARLWRETP